MSGQDDAEESRRKRYGGPYGPHHTIPTISKYREEKEARQAAAGVEDGDDLSRSWTQRAKDYYNREKDEDEDQQDGDSQAAAERHDEAEDDNDEDLPDEEPMVDTSQTDPNSGDPKAQRKYQKKRKNERAEREVTDPVTHLPVTIHDFTSEALKNVPENAPPMGSTSRSATGLSNKSKSNRQLQREHRELQKGREEMQALFPPPEYASIKQQIADIYKLGLTVGLVGAACIMALSIGLQRLLYVEKNTIVNSAVWLALGLGSVGGTWLLIKGVRQWCENKIDGVWDDEIWEANRAASEQTAKAHENESVSWLNSLLSSVWPLVNPDLFTSLADTLEDVMQASLPGLVQMVSVDDVGQGSESIRILGIRWLPTGAAARGVSESGKLQSAKSSKHQNDRSVPGEGEIDENGGENDGDDEAKKDGADQSQNKNDDGTEKEVAEGMEAEEGDFINLEVSFAYRARSSLKTFKDRTKDMHLYLAFYLPGNIKLPVWVDLRGVIGTMRMRLQLAPDPPFFALCTLTFLGQPKVELSCVPLVKKGLNIMDLPLISNFVQSSVNAAMAEYVAPKSLTLDLKDMLSGDDFKKDTGAKGVLVVHIKRGYDFKMGDAGIPLIKDGSADPYVSAGWAKFGKPLWSSRIMMSEMEPCWYETAYLLVSPDELNVDERLRIQLWDSDRFTADDDLGRIELDLKQLMKDDATNGKMQARTDGFRALKAGENMPGKLEWAVGYFSKVRIQECQLQQQTYDPEVRSMEQLDKKVHDVCERKLREANIKEGRNNRDKGELEQQKAQEKKAREDAMMISAPPPEGYPSGIFSIQIHQITGLELEQLNKKETDKKADGYDDDEEGQDLPSAYCTVIINHNKVFKTRTKPKNAKPFYNAGIERFIPDWTNAEVYVSVRDARWKEDNPLLGIVHLPLGELFKERSQIDGFYPLTGGVGYGRVRLSMVWRSVQLQAPPQDLGWQYGTLEVQSGISATNLPHDLQGAKLRFHTDLGYGKQYPKDDGWETRKQQSLKLAVRQRYASCLAIEFRRRGMARDKTGAFAVFWLRNIADEDEQEVTLPIWTGDYNRAKSNSLDEYGEKVGEIKVKMTFWSGLGGAHSQWANKDQQMHDVVEVLQVARDNDESHETAKQAGIVDEDDTSSSDEDSSSSSDDESPRKEKKRPDGPPQPQGKSNVEADRDEEASDDEQQDGKRNVLQSAMEYKKHMKQEHRRNRGLMQWKGSLLTASCSPFACGMLTSLGTAYRQVWPS